MKVSRWNLTGRQVEQIIASAIDHAQPGEHPAINVLRALGQLGCPAHIIAGIASHKIMLVQAPAALRAIFPPAPKEGLVPKKEGPDNLVNLPVHYGPRAFDPTKEPGDVVQFKSRREINEGE